jgi:hypothetical protein
LALPPAATFVGDCCEVEVAVAVCWVGALWMTVCDWPPPLAGALWTALTLCVVVFWLLEDAVAAETLVCWATSPRSWPAASEARAVPASNPAPIRTDPVQANTTKTRLGRFRMQHTIRETRTPG